jgi:hypothetical protein
VLKDLCLSPGDRGARLTLAELKMLDEPSPNSKAEVALFVSTMRCIAGFRGFRRETIGVVIGAN